MWWTLNNIAPILNEALKEYDTSEGKLDPDSPPETGSSYAPELR